MIYRVVIIDNGNQVSLTQQDNCTPCYGVDGKSGVDGETANIMAEALDKLREAKLDER